MLAQLIESISAINLVAGIIWTLLGAVIGTSLLLKRQHAPIQTLTTIACLLLAIVGAGMQFSPLLPNESLSLSFAQGFEIAFYCLLGLVLILLTLQTLKRMLTTISPIAFAVRTNPIDGFALEVWRPEMKTENHFAWLGQSKIFMNNIRIAKS